MTDNYELVGSIRRSLLDIKTHWDAMLVAPSSVSQGGAASARITHDDHDEAEGDIDRMTRVVSLRRFTMDVLNGWSRVVMEDRPVTKALPDGHSVLSMVEFLERHADWLSDHDAASDCSDELADIAKRIKNLVTPPRKEWHYLGDCPFVVEDWFCAGRVRVPLGGDETDATCSDCEQKAPVRWWELVLGMDEEIVDAPGMAAAIFTSLHMRVTERTVRNWARQERITRFVPFGPETHPDRPRYWFSVRSVLDEVARMDQECPVCGGIFSGEGRVCASCWYTMQNASRRYAEPKKPTPAARNLRPVRVVPDSHDTDRPERCHYSDLPLDQCACGRTHRQVSA